MASAANAQAKAGFKGSAAVSTVYTGISYFITAVILATPYFLTKIMLDALFASLVLAVLVIAFISFYGSVISGPVFSKDFVEVTSIMLAATEALYLLGFVIRHLTGIAIWRRPAGKFKPATLRIRSKRRDSDISSLSKCHVC